MWRTGESNSKQREGQVQRHRGLSYVDSLSKYPLFVDSINYVLAAHNGLDMGYAFDMFLSVHIGVTLMEQKEANHRITEL